MTGPAWACDLRFVGRGAKIIRAQQSPFVSAFHQGSQLIPKRQDEALSVECGSPLTAAIFHNRIAMKLVKPMCRLGPGRGTSPKPLRVVGRHQPT